jgi:hypothetical protein
MYFSRRWLLLRSRSLFDSSSALGRMEEDADRSRLDGPHLAVLLREDPEAARLALRHERGLDAEAAAVLLPPLSAFHQPDLLRLHGLGEPRKLLGHRRKGRGSRRSRDGRRGLGDEGRAMRERPQAASDRRDDEKAAGERQRTRTAAWLFGARTRAELGIGLQEPRAFHAQPVIEPAAHAGRRDEADGAIDLLISVERLAELAQLGHAMAQRVPAFLLAEACRPLGRGTAFRTRRVGR